MRRWAYSCRPRGGMVLIGVMWMVVLLTLIATVVAQSGLLDTHVAYVSTERIRLKWGCRAGLETAIALLGEDPKDGDSTFDSWSSYVHDVNSLPLDGCTFAIDVIDEAGKLNINTATREELLRLPDMTEEAADSILDWRDGDDDVREHGAESGYYINLTYGYEARNAPFKTVREVLWVRGVTPTLFYGDSRLDRQASNSNRGWVNYLTCYSYDLNVDAGGNARININTASEQQLRTGLGLSPGHAQWIMQNRTFDSIAGLLTDKSPNEPRAGADTTQPRPLDVQTFYSIVDKITVDGQRIIRGRVNVNTACREVLTAVLGDERAALDIIAYRETLGRGMTSLGELKNVASFRRGLARVVLGSLTTRSNVYSVTSTARADATRIKHRVEAVVDRDKSPAEVLYFRAGAIN